MLPFLKPKTVAGLIISHRKPDGGKEESHSEGNEDHGLDACSEDLIRAFHAKDTKGVSAGLKAAFEMLESSKTDSDDESYDSQNEKAAAEAKE